MADKEKKAEDKAKMEALKSSYRDIWNSETMQHHVKFLKESEDRLTTIAMEKSTGTGDNQVLDNEMAASVLQRAAAFRAARTQIERFSGKA